MMKQVHLKMPLRMLAALFGLILSASALGQQITVKGHVVDATGEGVIGATVRVNGTGGTVTDFDGNFTLQANQGDRLTVSYVGYKDATALAAPTVTIRMEDDTEALEEVVVIGYGRVKKPRCRQTGEGCRHLGHGYARRSGGWCQCDYRRRCPWWWRDYPHPWRFVDVGL